MNNQENNQHSQPPIQSDNQTSGQEPSLQGPQEQASVPSPPASQPIDPYPRQMAQTSGQYNHQLPYRYPSQMAQSPGQFTHQPPQPSPYQGPPPGPSPYQQEAYSEPQQYPPLQNYPHPQGHASYPPYPRPVSRPPQPPKSKATIVVIIAVLLSLLVVVGIIIGTFFIARHLVETISPETSTAAAVVTEAELSDSVIGNTQTAVETTAVNTETQAQTDTTSEVTETQASTEATDTKTTVTTAETTIESTTEEKVANKQEFPSDPYGRILTPDEMEINPAIYYLNVGKSPAAQASLAYFIDRQAFDLAFDYFREVALKSEYNDNNDNRIHVWEDYIKVEVRGNPTDEDIETLQRIITEINLLGTMPFVDLVDKGGNYLVNFVPLEEMGNAISGYVEGNWGFISIYWDEKESINFAEAAIATDMMTQEERNHIIIEEFIQGFGMLNDSYEYTDSIFQQEWTTVQDLLPIDWAVFRILYRPYLQSGMTGDEVYKLVVAEFFD